MKASLVSRYGLEGLRSIVLSHPRLPQMVRDKTLTFLCTDFQEITTSDCLGEFLPAAIHMQANKGQVFTFQRIWMFPGSENICTHLMPFDLNSFS